jgi:hypothetical protein
LSVSFSGDGGDYGQFRYYRNRAKFATEKMLPGEQMTIDRRPARDHLLQPVIKLGMQQIFAISAVRRLPRAIPAEIPRISSFYLAYLLRTHQNILYGQTFNASKAVLSGY